MSLFRKKTIENILKAKDSEEHGSLAKHLGVKDLTAFGIAAIIGAGIFLPSEKQARMVGRELFSYLFLQP